MIKLPECGSPVWQAIEFISQSNGRTHQSISEHFDPSVLAETSIFCVTGKDSQLRLSWSTWVSLQIFYNKNKLSRTRTYNQFRESSL